MPSASEFTEMLIADLRIPTLSNPLQLPAWPLDSCRYALFIRFLTFSRKKMGDGLKSNEPHYDDRGAANNSSDKHFIELLFSLLFRYYCVTENSVILARSIIITEINP